MKWAIRVMGGIPAPADTPRVGHELRRSRRSRGVALIEFTLVALLLFMLVFGIIGYGFMMSFQQSLTQAAAEGARAGAVAASADVETDAIAAVEQAMGGYGVECGLGGADATCTVERLDECPENPAKPCVRVTVSYPYRAHPLLPSVPGLNRTLPSELDYVAIAEVNE